MPTLDSIRWTFLPAMLAAAQLDASEARLAAKEAAAAAETARTNQRHAELECGREEKLFDDLSSWLSRRFGSAEKRAEREREIAELDAVAVAPEASLCSPAE